MKEMSDYGATNEENGASKKWPSCSSSKLDRKCRDDEEENFRAEQELECEKRTKTLLINVSFLALVSGKVETKLK